MAASSGNQPTNNTSALTHDRDTASQGQAEASIREQKRGSQFSADVHQALANDVHDLGIAEVINRNKVGSLFKGNFDETLTTLQFETLTVWFLHVHLHQPTDNDGDTVFLQHELEVLSRCGRGTKPRHEMLQDRDLEHVGRGHGLHNHARKAKVDNSAGENWANREYAVRGLAENIASAGVEFLQGDV